MVVMKNGFDTTSNDYTLFTTSQCNNNCIMCCQPPTKDDDIEELFCKNVEIVKSSPKELPVIGISGGEPTLLGDRLADLIKIICDELPNTQIHLLSNGRNFKDYKYAQKVVDKCKDKLTVGIPLHSDYHKDHDIIAGVKNSYYETVIGLFNLASYGANIELRIVINKLNYQRLPQIAEFIHKNLPFVRWTAFMGMEHTGYAVKNEQNIWIEPVEYIPQLTEAVKVLAQWNMDVSIYNIPLCLLPEEVHEHACKSISDWKVKYSETCTACKLKEQCCGLFETSKKTYEGLIAIR